MSHSTRIFLLALGTTFIVWTVWCALMAFVGEPFTSPLIRAFVRISAVLLPAIAYAHFVVKPQDDFWAFRRNWLLGLLVGATLSCFFCVLIVAQTSGQPLVIPVELSTWINLIVFSPLAEEMMFRRVALEHLKSITTTCNAIVVSSLLFSLLHLPW